MWPLRGARALTVFLLVGLGAGAVSCDDNPTGGGSDAVAARRRGTTRIFETNDPVERGCALERTILARIWNGYVPGRTFDLLFVPQYPNTVGGFDFTGHGGPWDYLQNVPLMLYGPRINAAGRISRPVDLRHIYPTMSELLGTNLARRGGRVLKEAVREDVAGSPRAVVMVVLDGVGRNVLERWPDAWPNLARLEEEGTSYVEATLGSSPSLTPATHATMATGVFPREHRVPSIQMRDDSGSVTTAFRGTNPGHLDVTTFADEYDRAHGNQPLAGLVGWSEWHLGLLGDGRQTSGGDADHLVILSEGGRISGNDDFYSTPDYLPGAEALEEHARAVDRDDGQVDGKWLGHTIREGLGNPASIRWQRDVVLEMLEREGYGQDRVPDLFFTNFKMADLVGHQYSIDGKEMEAIVRAEDQAVADLVDYLDARIGDYVLIITADHGHTPSVSTLGGWPVDVKELDEDLQTHLGVSKTESITERTTTSGFYLDERTRRRAGVTNMEIARFVNDYTIAENWDEDRLPEPFRGRGAEHVFSAAFMKEHLEPVMRCAFGAPKPPADAHF